MSIACFIELMCIVHHYSHITRGRLPTARNMTIQSRRDLLKCYTQLPCHTDDAAAGVCHLATHHHMRLLTCLCLLLLREEKGAIRRMKEAVTSSKPGEDTGKPDLLAGIKDWRSVYLGLLALLHAVAVTTFQLFTPLVIETLTSDILMDPNDAYILSVALTTTPYIFAIVFLGFTGYLQKYSPSSWRPWNGITIVVVTIILATILPPLYTSGIFLVSYLALCFLIGVTNSFTGIQDTLPAIYLQLGGASPSYFAAQSTFRGMAAIFSPPIFGALLPVLGASEAVRAIVLATKIPVLVLFVGWFYIIQRDMPI